MSDHLHAYKLKASTLQNIQDPKQKIKNEGMYALYWIYTTTRILHIFKSHNIS